MIEDPDSQVESVLPIRRLLLCYPTGRTETARGRYFGNKTIPGAGAVPGILPVESRVKEKTIVLFDPRAVALDLDTREIIYNPRMYLDVMERRFTRWLVRHPNWPPSIEVLLARDYPPFARALD